LREPRDTIFISSAASRRPKVRETESSVAAKIAIFAFGMTRLGVFARRNNKSVCIHLIMVCMRGQFYGAGRQLRERLSQANNTPITTDADEQIVWSFLIRWWLAACNPTRGT